MDMYKWYPTLKLGTELHLTPTGSSLFINGEPHELDKVQTTFIKGCNSVKTIGDIVFECLNIDDSGKLSLLIFVNSLLAREILLLSKTPKLSTFRITGSHEAYFPQHLTVELTAGCNLKCHHCYRESDSSKNEYLPTKKMLEILDLLQKNGLRSVELTGGEPFLHKDFKEILRFCVESFDLVGVLTNCTIMNDAIYNTLINLKDSIFLSVSLDASNAQDHDKRRGVIGSFFKTTRNIEKLSNAGVNIRVSMSVDEHNFHDIENTLLLAKQLGAVSFSYTPIMPIGRGKDWIKMNWHMDAQLVYDQEKNLQTQYDGFLSVLPDEKQEELNYGKSCGAGYRTFTMNPFGRIRPCAMYDEDKYVIGDLTTQSIVDVFKNTITQKLCKFPMPNPETCSGCKNELFCRYCGLRGMQGSTMNSNCEWIKQQAVKDVMNEWKYIEKSISPMG